MDKENPDIKYQFHFESNSYMDKNDREIDLGFYLQEEFSPGLRDWFWNNLNINVQEIEIGGSISHELIDLYAYDDKEGIGYVPNDILYNIFKDGPKFYEGYDTEDIEGALDIYPEDNINMEKFDYTIAYNILVQLFQEKFTQAEENYGRIYINLYPEIDEFRVWVDEEFQLEYFLRKVINEESIDFWDLADVNLTPYKIDPISTEDFKKLYKQQILLKTEKELEEAGQMKLFNDTNYTEMFEDNRENVAYIKMKNINKLLIKYGEKSMKATSEMKKLFDERTKKHIDLVRKYCKKIYDIYGDQFEGIIERGEAHDESKYTEPEIEPYIFITWDYKCKKDNEKFDIPEDIQNMMHKASEHHVNNNEHHPEFHCKEKGKINKEDRDANPDKIIDATAMDGLDICEMCADWCAMSEELENSPIDWADAKIDTRWKFSDEAIYLIYDILNNIWK
jgi:hypothetical protein